MNLLTDVGGVVGFEFLAVVERRNSNTGGVDKATDGQEKGMRRLEIK
jgi:hypothetical protein